MKTYTKLNGELAMWDVDTNTASVAISTVKEACPRGHRTAILAVAYEKPLLILELKDESL